MIDGLVAGRLVGDPEKRSGKAESHFVVAKIKATAADSDSYIVNVIAFDAALRQSLLGARDGDSVVLAGSLTPKVWVDKQGASRAVLDMVAHRIITLEWDKSDD